MSILEKRYSPQVGGIWFDGLMMSFSLVLVIKENSSERGVLVALKSDQLLLNTLHTNQEKYIKGV